jgi:SNF2 family DNA or RNA helicase
MFRIMFAHPQSAAHGLTLVKGTTTIWASPTYNLEHFVQGNKRIYRAGQTEKTETLVVLAEGTIDEKAYKALTEKGRRMDSLLEELAEAA